MTQKTGVLKCPYCRYEIKLTNEDTPPTNFAVLNAMDNIKEERERKGISKYYKPNYEVTQSRIKLSKGGKN